MDSWSASGLQSSRQPRLQIWRHPHVALGDRMDSIHQRLDGEALQDHTARAEADRRQGVSWRFAGGQDDDRHTLGQRLDIGKRIAFHLQVEQELIAGNSRQQRRQLRDAIGFADDDHPGLLRQQRLQPCRKIRWSSAMTTRTTRCIAIHACGTVIRSRAPAPRRRCRCVRRTPARDAIDQGGTSPWKPTPSSSMLTRTSFGSVRISIFACCARA